MLLRLVQTRLLGVRSRPGRRPSYALRSLGTASLVVCLAAAVALTPSVAKAATGSVVQHRHRHHHRHVHRKPASCATAATAADTAATAATLQTMRDTLVCLINQQRRDHGLPSLVVSPALDLTAQYWTGVMVKTGVYAHGDLVSRITDIGYDGQLIGENITTNAPTPEAVVVEWMASADHCQNILDPSFRDVGVGELPAAVGSGGPATWTMDFGLSMSQSALSTNWAPSRGCPY